jgi:hypothetical protein
MQIYRLPMKNQNFLAFIYIVRFFGLAAFSYRQERYSQRIAAKNLNIYKNIF